MTDAERDKARAASPVSAVKLQRHPLAFGITYWGPLPGTEDMYIQWDGPAGGLYLYKGSPETPGAQGIRIRHESASGTYGFVNQAEKAIAAFVAAGQGDD